MLLPRRTLQYGQGVLSGRRMMPTTSTVASIVREQWGHCRMMSNSQGLAKQGLLPTVRRAPLTARGCASPRRG